MNAAVQNLFDAVRGFSSLEEENRLREIVRLISERASVQWSLVLRIQNGANSVGIVDWPHKPQLQGETLSLPDYPELLQVVMKSRYGPQWKRIGLDSPIWRRLGLEVARDPSETKAVTIYPILCEDSDLAFMLLSTEKGFPENSFQILDQIERVIRLLFAGIRPIESPGVKPRTHRDEKPYIEMIGASEGMRQVFSMIRKFALVDAPVLITGESGTGKELVAQSIHERSHRSKGPLVAINCGAIPETLLESELFGHERGSFTGALGRKKGMVEMAQGGTLFLDEIGDLSLPLQVKILRFLETHRFERVGGTQPIEVDVRVIAATNKDLAEAIQTGGFRRDLYYRLAVLSLHLPSLRERGEDIMIMAQHFFKQYTAETNRNLKGYTPEALETIKRHRWPGNIRELVNAIRRAVILCEGEYIAPSDMGFEETKPGAAGYSMTLTSAKGQFERELVIEAIHRCGGNISRTARELDVSRPHLYALIKKHNIPTRSTAQEERMPVGAPPLR